MKNVNCSCKCNCAPKLGQTFPSDFIHHFVPIDIEMKFKFAQTFDFREGCHIWTDGTNMYYSHYTDQYVLNGDTWEKKNWNGANPKLGYKIWTDGTNIYYSDYNEQYVLNGDTWVEKTWNVTDNLLDGLNVWTDGTNIYYSGNTKQYILDGDKWVAKPWGDNSPFMGKSIWTDGTNIYYSNYSITLTDSSASALTTHYILNNGIWEEKVWNISAFDGLNIWTDGTNIYYSNNYDYDSDGNRCSTNLILKDGNWEEIEIGGTRIGVSGSWIWTDGINIYYSSANTDSNYNMHNLCSILIPSTAKLYYYYGSWEGPYPIS